MPPVMMTKPWPMAKRPNRPTRFAVLARLIGERNRGLIDRHDGADHEDQDQEPEVLLLHRRPLRRAPTASSSTRCSENSSRSRMPLIAPSCMTAMRSLTPITSSMSLEIIRTATPASASAAQHVVDLALGADVDAARRLVEDDRARLHRQPLRQHDLLLVAAGERADRRLDAGRADVEPPPLGLGQRASRARAATSPARRERRELRQRDVLGDRRGRGCTPLRLAVLGHQVDARARSRRAARRSATALRRRAGPRRRAAGRCRRRARASSVRPAPISPARPRISPRRTVEVDARAPG